MPIRPDLPPEPDFGAPLDPAHPSPETLRLLALRRSTPVSALTEPGPSAEDLDAILRLGMRVPTRLSFDIRLDRLYHDHW
jgi:hypothetical protein